MTYLLNMLNFTLNLTFFNEISFNLFLYFSCALLTSPMHQ